jgi:glycerol-3-phosphate dehydrogenase
LTATGGKYTSSRAFAARIVTRLGGLLGRTLPRSRTAETPLDGCALGDPVAAAGRAVSLPVD